VLIPAFLLHTARCYSSTFITTEELTVLDREEEIFITTTERNEFSAVIWDIEGDTLKLDLSQSSNDEKVLNDKAEDDSASHNYHKIPFTKIEIISYKYLNIPVTALAVFFCGALPMEAITGAIL
jgi:hypothetical protein